MKAQEALQEALLQSSLNEIYLFCRVNFTFVFANKVACSNLGYTVAELGSMTPLDIEPELKRQQFQELLSSLENSEKKEVGFNTVHKRKDRTTYPVEVHIQLIRSEERDVYLAIVNDIIGQQRTKEIITSREKNEKEIMSLNDDLEKRVRERTSQLEDANRELEAFAYSVSHDLRAPLRAIEGYSRIVLEEYSGKIDAEGERLLGLVRDNARLMDQLIKDLLELSRVLKIEMHLSMTDINGMVKTVFSKVVEGSINQGNAELRVGEMPGAFADRSLLEKALKHLISNAVKFSSGRDVSVIEVGGAVVGDFCNYYVRDNGVGFNPDFAYKLFGIFQRLHGRDEFEGNGVGLAIVSRIINRHGGRVWAQSIEGTGATFYFSLPNKQAVIIEK